MARSVHQRRDLLADRLERGPERVVAEVRVDFGRHAAVTVPQRPLGDVERGAALHHHATERPPEIVNSDILECGALADALPRLREIDEMLAVLVAGKNPWAAVDARQRFQHAHGMARERDRLNLLRLGLGYSPESGVEVDVGPPCRQGFATTCAGQQEKAQSTANNGIALLG